MSSTDEMQDLDSLSSYIGIDPELSVLQLLTEWPFAAGLLSQTCELQWSSRRHPDFSEYFPSCVKVAVENADIPATRIVFETGARSQLATSPILQSGIEEGFAAAVRTFSIPVMQYFVAKGVDVNKRLMKREARPESPLAYAIRRNSPALVSFLIDVGADIEMPDLWGRYPLSAAVEDHRIEITQVLVAAGANVNVREEAPWGPPLCLASRAEVARELLKARHNDDTLRLALESAVHSSMNSPGVLMEILAHFPDTSSLPDIDCLLHYQVLHSNTETLRLLLGDKYKLDVTKKSVHGDTPLHWVSERTSVAVVQLLLSYGAQIEAVNNRGSTPLTVAASQPNFPVAAYLVERGALVNASHGATNSPFFWACNRGGVEMVQVMRNSSVDPANINMVNTTNMMGTPLNAALFRVYNDEDSIFPIIEREREKIVQINEQVVRYLLDKGNAATDLASTYWRSAFQVACLTCPISTISMLIERSPPNVNAADFARRTPLHMALYRTPAHVQLLLNLGANLDAVDAVGRNALHFAVLSGNLDVIRLVLEKRPGFVDKEDFHGWTPLLWALRCREGEALKTPNWVPRELRIRDVVKELISRGARRLVRVRGASRTWTPMVVAKYYGWLNPGTSTSNVRDLLLQTPDDNESLSDRDVEWDWNASGGKVGKRNPNEFAWCDHCLLRLDGYFYVCAAKNCVAGYCAHCYQSRDKLHNPEHKTFHKLGGEEDVKSDNASGSSTDDEFEDDYEEGEDDYGVPYEEGGEDLGEQRPYDEARDPDMVNSLYRQPRERRPRYVGYEAI
ncbi:ankyrin repeat-containing domain protein [Xylariaceae sp. FL1272]|nr:ankyrin repeat-containing domain protein [Xylariaceae sp. FL1272]